MFTGNGWLHTNVRTKAMGLVVCLLCAASSSCMTMKLWGVDYKSGYVAHQGRFEPARNVDWSWWSIMLRAAGTPLTVVFDLVTLPVQSYVYPGYMWQSR